MCTAAWDDSIVGQVIVVWMLKQVSSAYCIEKYWVLNELLHTHARSQTILGLKYLGKWWKEGA